MRLDELVNAPDQLLYHWTDETAYTIMTHYNIVFPRTETFVGADQMSGKVRNPIDNFSAIRRAGEGYVLERSEAEAAGLYRFTQLRGLGPRGKA